MRKNIALIGVFIAGVIFRLWFISLVPQPQFVFDQEQYLGYALGILKFGLHADVYRLYGYPILIVPFIALFGREAILPWQIMQAMMDTTTGLLVFFMARKIFADKRAAWLSFGLYIINPFTSTYVGVMLSEVAATFFLTLGIFVLTYWLRRKKYQFLITAVMLFSYLVQIRPSFFYITLGIVAVMVWKIKFSLVKRLLIVTIFALPFLYTITGNVVRFHQFALLGVDNAFVRELYTSLFATREIPNEKSIFYEYPPEAYRIWGEYSTPTTEAGRNAMAQKYWELAVAEIRRDPRAFVLSRLTKMGYIWEKHYLFPYRVERLGDFGKAIVYWGNIGLLGTAGIGFLSWDRKSRGTRGDKGNKGNMWVSYLVWYLFLGVSVVHTISTAAERFSLPLYPLVMLFAGYALVRVFVICYHLCARFYDLHTSSFL